MDSFSRFQYAANLQGRNYNEVFGYPSTINVREYRQMYERGDIAEAIVKAKPEATWGGARPHVRETENYKIETPFEESFAELEDNLQLFPMLERADIISGIGHYGGLFIGWNDGQEFDKPVRKNSKVAFLDAFAEDTLRVNQIDLNPSSKRYGQPLMYEAAFEVGEVQEVRTTKLVHWTRVVHLADNRIESKVFGIPRLKPVYNRVLDLHKILGSDAEAFWLGAFGGIALEADADAVIDDKEAMNAEVEKYVAGLQRFMRLQGITAKTLNVQIQDPANHVLVQLQLISAQTGIPLAILIGSGRGELSSSNDFKLWVERAAMRRKNYAEPYILRPFIDRLIEFGALPAPQKYSVSWHDSNITVIKEQLDSARVLVDAIRMYNEAGGYKLIPPGSFLEDILKVPAEKVELYSPASADELEEYKRETERRKGQIDDSSFKKVGKEEKKISAE